MGIRKSVEETVVLNGTGAYWGPRCVTAMQAAGFTVSVVNEAAGRVEGKFRTATVWGELVVTLLPAGAEATQVTAKASANADNIYAVFRSPGRKILEDFKSALTQLPP